MTATRAGSSEERQTGPPDAGPVVLFDGVCNVCDATVRWIIRRDRRGVFRFASLQSRAGRAALERAGVTGAMPDSVVLIDGGRVLTKSDAALGIAARLGPPWSLAGVLGRWAPRRLRDGVYAFIARNRYRWFGRKDACMMPDPGLRSRFLADVDGDDLGGM